MLINGCKCNEKPQIYERKWSQDNLSIKTPEKFELKKILVDKSNVLKEQKSPAKLEPDLNTLNESDTRTMSSTTDSLIKLDKR